MLGLKICIVNSAKSGIFIVVEFFLNKGVLNQMDFLLYVLFSSLEYLAIFALMFALFRFEYKFYHNSVLFICAVLSFVTYSLRYGFEQAYLGPIANLLLIFAFLYYIFQIQIFYSGIMAVTGYLAYIIIQIIIFIVLDTTGILNVRGIEPNTLEGYILQLSSTAVAMATTYFIKRKNYGFAYVPHGQRAFVLYKGLNKLFLYLIILGAILVSIMLYFNTDENRVVLVIMTALLIVIFTVIIYLSIRKEYSHD